MKKLCLALLVNLLFINAFAQTQEYKKYFDSNVLKVEGFKNENEKKIGEWKTFHENGQLKETGNYLEGIKIGEWNYYDEIGKLINTESFD